MKSPDKNKKKSHPKVIKSEDLKRSKKFTLRNYCKFIFPLIDRRNYGYMKDNETKSFRYSAEWISRVPYKSYITLREKYRTSKYYDISINDHLRARQNNEWFLFYTSNQYSDVCFLTGDIDPIDGYGYEECLEACHYIRNKFHPNTYLEPSTSGGGILFYILIDFSTFPKHFGIYDKYHRYNCNNIIDQYSKLLSEVIDSMFNCHFDSFFGTYPLYSFDYNFIYRGKLGKLPCPQSHDDYTTLINTPITTYSDLEMNWRYMQELLYSEDICSYSFCRYYFSGFSSFHSCSHYQACSNSPSCIHNTNEPTETTSASSTSSISLCLYTGTFENVADIKLEKDTMLRSRRYLYYCFMKYVLEYGREPTKEEYIEKYRKDVGTGTEDEQDRIRLEYIYKTKIDQMRKYAYGSFSKQINMVEEKLSYTQEEIDELSSYNRKLYPREVSIAAVWIGLCLTNKDYIGKKEWWSIGKTEHFGRELTVPTVSLEKFIECLRNKELTKNGCNHHKAKALRELLISIEWIECVDDTVIIAEHNKDKKGGRARRYILLPDHPNYSKFENIVGSDRIEYWKRFRHEQLMLRNVKSRSRRVG